MCYRFASSAPRNVCCRLATDKMPFLEKFLRNEVKSYSNTKFYIKNTVLYLKKQCICTISNAFNTVHCFLLGLSESLKMHGYFFQEPYKMASWFYAYVASLHPHIGIMSHRISCSWCNIGSHCVCRKTSRSMQKIMQTPF